MRERSGWTSGATGRVRSGGRRTRTGLALVTAGLVALVMGGPAFAGLMAQPTAGPSPSAAAPSPAPGASVMKSPAQRADSAEAAHGSPAPAGVATNDDGPTPANGTAPAAASVTRSADPTTATASSDPGSDPGDGVVTGPVDADGNPADAVADDPATDSAARAGVRSDPASSATSGPGEGPVDGLSAQAEPSGAPAGVGGAGIMSVPASPGQVAVVPLGQGLRVTWVHDGTDVDHFVATAYDQHSTLAGSCLGAGPGAVACDIGTGVTAGEAYTVQVVAYGGTGAADPSAPATSAVVVAGAPNAPTGAHATVISPTAVTVGWAHPAGAAPIDHYEVRAVQDAALHCATVDGDTLSCDVTGLDLATQYTFRVVAKSAVGDSPWSQASAPVTPGGAGPQPAAPGEPAGLVVEPGDQQLMLEWQLPAEHGDGIAGYTVHVVGEPGRDCVTLVRHCTIGGLANGTAYTVRVQTNGVAGDSGWVTAAGTPSLAPGEPVGVTATARIEAITVSWVAGAPGTGVARFQALATATVGDDQGVCESVDGSTCTISGLKSGDTYTVAVKAIGRHGRNSQWSAPAQAAVPDAVTVPASVPAGAGGFGSSSGDLVAPGEQVTVSGSGFAPHSTVKVAIYSAPLVLATTMTDGTGTFSVSVTVPEGYRGAHTLVVAGVDAEGAARYLTMAVTVEEEYQLTAFGDAGGSVLAVTGDPVGGIAGTGAALVLAGAVLLASTGGRRKTR